jgi:hemolysin III
MVWTLLGPQPVSSISHLAAAGAALVGAVPLLRLGRGHPGGTLALTIYASCVIAALAISGVYHALDPGSSARLFMQRLDHCAIWCLIAGTFTGVHGVMWRGFWRWGLLAFIWSLALLGVLLQILWFHAFAGDLGLALYLGLGWLGLVSLYKLARQIGWARALPLLYAGIAYSAGAIFEATSWRPVVMGYWVGAHEVFHFAVILGVTLHWLFIRKLVLIQVPATVTANVHQPDRKQCPAPSRDRSW